MDSAELPHGTVTFLFTDIEGSTELARRLGPDFVVARADHHRRLREAITKHGGHEIDTAGDGFFVAFERAGDAVKAALDAQRALLATEVDDIAVRVRMGLHSAEPYLHEDGYVGVGVHRAARICAAGHGGQILLSNATAGIVEDLALEGVELEDLGEHVLKDIERPQRVFQIRVRDLPHEFPPLRTATAATPALSVVTVLMTDVVGWRSVLRSHGDDVAGVAAERYQAIVVDVVRAEGGREREVAGDTVVAVFDRPPQALRAAVRVRDRLRDEPWSPGGEDLEVCIAIHSGRMGVSGHMGSLFYRCFQLCASAKPGQILVSHATEALLEGEVLEIELRDLGERELAESDRAVRVFELVA